MGFNADGEGRGGNGQSCCLHAGKVVDAVAEEGGFVGVCGEVGHGIDGVDGDGEAEGLADEVVIGGGFNKFGAGGVEGLADGVFVVVDAQEQAGEVRSEDGLLEVIAADEGEGVTGFDFFEDFCVAVVRRGAAQEGAGAVDVAGTDDSPGNGRGLEGEFAEAFVCAVARG